jgi:isoquinoline 1-oxidoreductase beta subunit
MSIVMNRRQFLQVIAIAGGGFALGFTRAGEGSPSAEFAPNPWVRFEPSGIITILVDKSEMGQGVMTSLPMILADEMDADWTKIRVEFAPAAKEYAHPWFHTQATGGSTSVRAMWIPLRQAGAAARQMFRQAAAHAWNVPVDHVKTKNGILSAGLHRATFAEMVKAASRQDVPQNVPLKDPKDFVLIGKPMHRLDSHAKATGSAHFGLDVRMPGLLTAVVARSPVIGGKLVSFNGDEALKIKGVRQVLAVESLAGQGVAVLADNTWLAMKGREALKIEWDNSAHPDLSTEQLQKTMAQIADSGSGGKTARIQGEPRAVSEVKTVLRSRYEVPYLAHAPMEPMNCTAWVKEDGVDVWAGTQAQGPHQMIASQITDVPLEKVRIHTQFLGGGFGRRFAPDFVVEAVTLSKNAGLPVKVVYTREDDLHAYCYRPMATCSLEAKLDRNGKLVSLESCVVSDSIAESSHMEAAMVKNGIDQTSVEGLADIPYDIPNIRVDWAKFQPGIPVWFWRSVGHTQNSFFSECFMDELAHEAQQDPFEFRRALLDKSPKHKAVLELAASKAGWGEPLPPGRARGIAVVESFGSRVAEVAEVSLVDGKPRVHRVVVAADVGTIVNPDTVAAQMESAVLFGLSAALYGQITFSEGKPQQTNFHDYPIVRLGETPKVEVYTVNSSDNPGGVGEPGTPPIAPAVCNALFALTGKRIYRLPLSETNFSRS